MLNDSECIEIADKALERFKGNSERLKGAIGYLFISRQLGWKVSFLMHSQRTVREYEEILGIDSRAAFPEVGPKAEKSMAWRIAKDVSNFWKAVKGEIKGVRSSELE
ncbi:MAG TPA: hypothetical protein VEB70_04810 [Noviherbaspirillum sp.]|nr:hypothetical protein [Noviherbaspirillum sp.]